MSFIHSARLTVTRRVAARPAAKKLCLRPIGTRSFAFSATRAADKYPENLSTDDSVKTDQFPDGEHATDKKDKLDVQSENSSKGRE